MWRKSLQSLIFASLTLAGCVSETTVTPTNTVSVENLVEQPPIILHPPINGWLSGWEMGTDLVVSEGDFTFALHLIEITPNHTAMVYSSSGAGLDQFAAGKSVQLVDQNGQKYELLQATSLGQFGGLYFGALTFSVRQPDASELHLVIQPDKAGRAPLDILAAQVYGSLSEINPYYWHRTWFMAGGEGHIEQGSHKISFNGWGLSKGDSIAEALARPGKTHEEVMQEEYYSTATAPSIAAAPSETPGPRILSPPYPPMPTGTPEWLLPTVPPTPPNPIAGELANGKRITVQATLRVEDTLSGQVDYLYILFLEDGEVKATVLP